MTTHLERTIEVPGRQQAVFDYIADFSNAESWDPGVAAASRIDDAPIGVGNEYRLTVTFAGRSLETTYRTTQIEPPSLVKFEGGTAQFTSIDTITVTQKDAETVGILYVADFILDGPLRFFEPLLRRSFHRLADKAVAGLREELSP